MNTTFSKKDAIEFGQFVANEISNGAVSKNEEGFYPVNGLTLEKWISGLPSSDSHLEIHRFVEGVFMAIVQVKMSPEDASLIELLNDGETIWFKLRGNESNGISRESLTDRSQQEILKLIDAEIHSIIKTTQRKSK